MKTNEIQKIVSSLQADAWIAVDYESKNPALAPFLGKKMLTRKLFLVIPATQRPYIICHTIDRVYLDVPEITQDFDLRIYKTWEEMLELEKTSFSAYQTVLMDISENGLIPKVSHADFGSVSFVQSLGITVKPSGDLLQYLTAVLDEKALQSQIKACKLCLKIKDEAFRFIALKIQQSGSVSEWDVQQFIANRFHAEGMVFDEAPIVAIGPNASNPHYAPSEETSSLIQKEDLVLIDMWAKLKENGSVYADITWMGYVGKSVPEVYASRFNVIRDARDAAIAFLSETLPFRPVHAFEADQAARKVIEEAGYGPYFTHRLGHSIYSDESPHGPGANLDDYESHDARLLIDGTSFSDEPGIYAPDFGMRTETDLHVQNGRLLVLGGLQEAIIPIMKLL